MRSRAVTALFLALAVAVIFAVGHAAPSKQASEPALIYTSTPHFESLAWLQGGERFPSGAKLILRDGDSREFAKEVFATADANVSFDGTRVLFAGKKSASDVWQIWEARIAGTDAKQLTKCDGDCVRPFYLPENRIVYAHKTEGRFQLEALAIETGVTLRLSSIPGNALPTDVLRDGRILFEAGYPLGEGRTAELYTVYSDGSGVEAYRCDHGPNRHSGRQTSSGDILFASDAGAALFTSALAHAVDVRTPGGDLAGEVIEISEGRYLAAWRPHTAANYSLLEWDTANDTLSTWVSAGNADAVQPEFVTKRMVPNRHPSGLHDWNGANVLCLNAYTSKLKIANGSVASVNLYTRSEGKTVLMGNAGVEGDGSFFLHVPADQPIQLELLDKSGNTVQREHGWFWMRRGEQRVCVGCHAGPERSPENAVPQVLVKSTEPADMTGKAMSLAKGGH